MPFLTMTYAGWREDLTARLETIGGLLRSCVLLGEIPDPVARGDLDTVADHVRAIRERPLSATPDPAELAWVAQRLAIVSRAATLVSIDQPCREVEANRDLAAAADDLRSLAEAATHVAALTPLSFAFFRGAA